MRGLSWSSSVEEGCDEHFKIVATLHSINNVRTMEEPNHTVRPLRKRFNMSKMSQC